MNSLNTSALQAIPFIICSPYRTSDLRLRGHSFQLPEYYTVPVFEWGKRRTGTLCRRTPKARGVSMQLGGMGSAVSSPAGPGGAGRQMTFGAFLV